MAEDDQQLSTTERLQLMRTLKALPAPQFAELVFALRPPNGNLPNSSASQVSQIVALLEWVESPLGVGLSELKQTLDLIMSAKKVETMPAQTRAKRIFISYEQNVEPDERLALVVYQAISQSHHVFMERFIPMETPWVEQIEQELQRSDFLIVFLSAQSIRSEMLLGEVKMARTLGSPTILPVRVAYREPFAYPLNAYLDSINWAMWETETDTSGLINELIGAISGGKLSIQGQASKGSLLQTVKEPLPKSVFSNQSLQQNSRSVALEKPEQGTIQLESNFYITRSEDTIALEAIQNQGVTITIKAPRQMGKSSLLIRVMDTAIKSGKKIAFMDFQLFNESTLANADKFFRQFCSWITDEVELENRVDEYWSGEQSNNLRCTRYMQRYLLKQLDCPLVLAMDEVESVFDTSFRSDFFSMLRSWHNNRAIPSTRIWKQLDLALITSTEPY